VAALESRRHGKKRWQRAAPAVPDTGSTLALVALGLGGVTIARRRAI
jgi:hypothetical protein